MEWYLRVWANFGNFSDRARRREYWMFELVNVIVSIVLMLADGAIGAFSSDAGLGLLSGLYMIAVLVPSLAVSVRRLHDIGRSGWSLLLLLIPIAGPIAVLVFMLKEGTPGPNQYGEDPKAPEAQIALA